VALQALADYNEQNDYVNASWMSFDDVPYRYISTQGPLAETTPHFWQMVWESEAPVIVMLTREIENGQVWGFKQAH